MSEARIIAAIKAALKTLLRFLPITCKIVTPTVSFDISNLVAFPPGFSAMNPSIVMVNDQYLVCIRGVNYNKGKYGETPTFNVGDRYMTRNRFLLLDSNFCFVKALTDLDNKFDDIEDIKLFTFKNRIMGIGSQLLRSNDAEQLSICLLSNIDTVSEISCTLIASPFSINNEKNWAPFVYDDELYFVYSFEPLILLKYDVATGTTQIINLPFAETAIRNFSFMLSGSSAGLPVSDGFLFAAHRRRISPFTRRLSYFTRIYHLNMPEMKISAGRYFSIGPPNLQFVNGFLQIGDFFLVSYGASDRSAHVSLFPISSIL